LNDEITTSFVHLHPKEKLRGNYNGNPLLNQNRSRKRVFVTIQWVQMP